MRRLLMVWVVAATTGLVSANAWAGNQEIADQIAATLRDSGQFNDYKISVKFQDGTVWLEGRVRDQEQMNRAEKTAFRVPGVVRVVNSLTIGTGGAQATPASTQGGVSGTVGKLGSSMAALNPLRKSSDGTEAGRAQQVPTSFSSRGAVPVAMMQPVPPAPAPTPPAAAKRAEPAPLPPRSVEPAAPGVPGPPLPMYAAGAAAGPAPMRHDQPSLPNYSWPTYAAYPNYASVTYPKQYSPTAWPYIGPFYPYPQVPLGWRKVSLEWDDGWWFLDFKDKPRCCWWR